METIAQRLAVRDEVIQFVRQTKPSLKCFVDGKFNSIKLGKKLGSGDNVQGDVYKGCTTDDSGQCNIDVALKVVMPVTSDVELTAMDVLVNVLKERRVPNIPLLYMWGKCPDCRFADGSMWVSDGAPPVAGEYDNPGRGGYRRYGGEEIPCTTFLCEYAAFGDIDNWLRAKPSEGEVYNVLFQLVAGFATLYYNYGMTHNDVHLGNILVHETKPGGYWEYFICGKRYMCPNVGLLGVLWDFGFATIPGVIGVQQDYVSKNGYFQSVTHLDMYDLRRLCQSIRSKMDSKFLRKICEYINTPDATVAGVLDTFFCKYEDYKINDGIIETYFTSSFADIECFERMDTPTLARVAHLLDGDMWRAVVVNRGLSVAEMRRFQEHVDWGVVSATLRDHAVAREFGGRIDWRLASTWKEMGEPLIEEHIDEVDWRKITRHADMSAAFVARHRDRVVWALVDDERIAKWCTGQILAVAGDLPWDRLALPGRTIRSCRKLQAHMNWRTVSAQRPMGVEFVREFRDLLVPAALTGNPHIDFDAIASEFPELIVWSEVATSNVATLRLFADKLDWALVSRSLHEAQVAEFSKHIDWGVLQEQVTLSSATLDKHIGKIDFATISRTQFLEPWFVDKYSELLDWGHVNIALFDRDAIVRHSRRINWTLADNVTAALALDIRLVAEIERAVWPSRTWAPDETPERAVFWRLVSRGATDAVVAMYGDRLEWDEVSAHGALSAGALWKNSRNIDFAAYSRYELFSFTDYVILTGWLDYAQVAKNARLPKALVRMFSDVFSGKGVIGSLAYVDFDWEFFRKHRNAVDWRAVERTGALPALFRREFSEFLEV